jgi:ornithine--oxo-acid transaminase
MGYSWDNVKPDLVAVGKALSGGMMPVSGAFALDEVMNVIVPGDHGSTFGGNPLAMAVARAAIEVLLDEGMVENSLRMGNILGDELRKLKSPLIKDVRGRGLFWAIEVHHDTKIDGTDFAYVLMKLGLLTKATHTYSLRLAPALMINEKQILEAVQLIKVGLKELESLNKSRAKINGNYTFLLNFFNF